MLSDGEVGGASVKRNRGGALRLVMLENRSNYATSFALKNASEYATIISRRMDLNLIMSRRKYWVREPSGGETPCFKVASRWG